MALPVSEQQYWEYVWDHMADDEKERLKKKFPDAFVPLPEWSDSSVDSDSPSSPRQQDRNDTEAHFRKEAETALENMSQPSIDKLHDEWLNDEQRQAMVEAERIIDEEEAVRERATIVEVADQDYLDDGSKRTYWGDETTGDPNDPNDPEYLQDQQHDFPDQE